MIYSNEFNTARLTLQPLSHKDEALILELLNTAGWLQFIGNRNINKLEDAGKYIERITGNSSIQYWTVKLRSTATALGLVTCIQRDYLDHPDIGFAFLPQYNGNGYAFEAAETILQFLLTQYPVILATTMLENTHSIQLLKKLGLSYLKEITPAETPLLLYATQTR
jgi:[ribosomal protein S5]-alanine N-acetyltransferase